MYSDKNKTSGNGDASQGLKIGFQQYFYDHLPEVYVKAEAAAFANPTLLYYNHEYADCLLANLPTDDTQLAHVLSGQTIASDAKPIAQAYAGHQFGYFNPQLGDGRAMILGELLSKDGSVHELDLKGSGPTPFSRGGDGKAAIGPMLREVLVGEAMHALGVPTTRSLAVIGTSETVYRNPPQPGAVLARTAQSHIRIGTFQFFAAREQYDVVKKLVAFCLKRHYSNNAISTHDSELANINTSDTPALQLLKLSIQAQARLIAKWMGLGFIHGVMNTDNMLIGAQTIDYGPCAFMDDYEPNAVFSSIDQNSRYAYSNQAGVAQWNLSRFAETLLPLIDDDKDKAIELATQAVKDFLSQYEYYFRQEMSHKLGLLGGSDETNQNSAQAKEVDRLIQDWLDILHSQKIDWTNAHLHLTGLLLDSKSSEQGLSAIESEKLFYSLFEDSDIVNTWLEQRAQFNMNNANLTSELKEDYVRKMMSTNPAVIPRNHLVEEALQAATDTGDLSLFNALLKHVTQPFEVPKNDKYMQGGSKAFYQGFRTFCGT